MEARTVLRSSLKALLPVCVQKTGKTVQLLDTLCPANYINLVTQLTDDVMNLSMEINSSAARPAVTIVNRPKTFFYPIGWMTVVSVVTWLVWVAVIG